MPRHHANRGATLEAMLATQHELYALTGRAMVIRTTAPMRILRRLPKGQFVAVFEAVGMPDYIALHAGRVTVFDAKQHEGERFPFSALPEHQAAAFDAATKQGATAGLVIRLPDVGACWFVPWPALSARYWSWAKATTRAAPGSASLTVEGLDGCGVRCVGVDWLRALT